MIKQGKSMRKNLTSAPLKERAQYPILAKKASDGMYCYVVQRRISHYISVFCVKNGITANWATAIDLLFGVLAAICLSQGYYMLGIIGIQIFGIWSCVDGEVARLTNSSSKFGDFFDTMTDRAAEFLIFGGVFYSLAPNSYNFNIGMLFFSYIGMVFLITASSEKFRSVYHKNYPKRELEGVFNWLCAGSDTRFLYLSLVILAFSITKNILILKWFLIVLTVLLAANFIFRIWKVSQLEQSENNTTHN